MLVLIWAAKYFRCYLYGQKFIVRTDHAAPTHLKSFADHNPRLMRWSLKLSNLDFTVEHRAGTKIPHVDVLSQHVAAVIYGGTLSCGLTWRTREGCVLPEAEDWNVFH
jgi:hypothetical protein